MKQYITNIFDRLLWKGLQISDILKYDALRAQRAILEECDDVIIFDVGANEGQTVQRFRKHFPDAEFYCFEPTHVVAERLKNRFSDDSRVKVVQKAVTDTVGSKKFFQRRTDSAHSPQSGTNSLFQRPKSGKQYYMEELPKQTAEVESTTLDRFLEEKSIERVHVLKIDVEGAELLALQGAQKALAEQLFDLVYVESSFVERWENAPLCWEIWRFLEAKNYSLYNFYNFRRAEDGQVRFGDALFVRNSLRK